MGVQGGVRRVVTGERADGKSVIVSDEVVEPLSHRKGGQLHRLWGSDDAPTLPEDGSVKPAELLFPPPGGFRFTMLTMAPRDKADVARELDDPEVAANTEKLGITDLYEKDRPGMHATETIDLLYVLSGEVYLELDDGAEVHLKAGDSVVQNGTKHAWWNRSDEPCVMLAACIGAARQND
jgi:quercetin dioxygenase-like cupin family protein